MMFNVSYQIDEIDEVSQKIKSLIKYSVVCFEGEMGAGKTTLINSLCKQYGVIGNTSSPTFSLLNEYMCQDNQVIYHFDLYRLKSAEEALDFGIENYLDSPNLCLIEWPLIVEKILPLPYHLIKIKTINNHQRWIEIFDIIL